jgi:predicted membrane-bound dolichyl-phosphate-mannose-protein mannosyltransferase
MVGSGMDGVAVFGFLSGFFTLVLLGYRHQLRTRLPVIALGMACCGMYGILAGAYSAGIVLIALTASEFRRWWDTPARPQVPTVVTGAAIYSTRIECESRISRMFGRA